MAFGIQRVPRGLASLLSVFGSQTPTELEQSIRAVVDATQYYGRTQLQTLSLASLNVGTGAALTFTVPNSQTWLLFHAAATVVGLAGMTAASLAVTSQGASMAWGRNAVAVGQRLIVPFVSPYPIMLLPGQQLSAFLVDAIGGNGDLSFDAVVGVLG